MLTCGRSRFLRLLPLFLLPQPPEDRKNVKKLFIAATGQNAGKTTVSLGLIMNLEDQMKVGFIKPVGQRYLETPRGRFDEDAILIDEVCKLDCNLDYMSPVTVGKGFTRDYILGRITHSLDQQILDAFAKIADGKELVVIEGTGHAGVGSVIGLSNARVGSLLGAPVLIVAPGGIGLPIDEVALNLELFRKEGVRVVGVVLNKVAPAKLDMVNDITRKGLEKMGVPLCGAIPEEPFLSGPTMRQILGEIGGRLINGPDYLDNHIERIVVGAMTPHQFLDYLAPNMLVITGGDREDLILGVMSSYVVSAAPAEHVAGMVLTGGIAPHRNIMQLISRTTMPVIVVQENSYQTASRIHDLTTKIQPTDMAKIAMVSRMVRQHVDLAGVCERI